MLGNAHSAGHRLGATRGDRAVRHRRDPVLPNEMVNYQEAYSIALYPPRKGKKRTQAETKKKTGEKLVTNNRAEFVAEANFETDGSVYLIATMLIRRIVDEFNPKMNLGAR